MSSPWERSRISEVLPLEESCEREQEPRAFAGAQFRASLSRQIRERDDLRIRTLAGMNGAISPCGEMAP